MDQDLTDESLADRARGGDREAFGHLVERHRPRLQAIVRSRLGSELRRKVGEEDITQETLAQALQSIASFKWQGKESFGIWLAGIAEHTIQMAARGDRRHPQVPLAVDPPARNVSPSRGLRREERLVRLERALAKLPPVERKVLRLFRIDGLKHAEIATRTGRSPEAVRQITVRALRRLRALLGETESLGLPVRPERREKGTGDGD